MKISLVDYRIPLLLVCAAGIVSCDRHQQLLKDREKVDQEAERVLMDTQILDQKILSLGGMSASAVITIERRTNELEQKLSLLQSEVESHRAKLKALESATQSFGAKVDAYKAKYLR